MFEYKVEFGNGVNIKIGTSSEQSDGKLMFLGALGDVSEVKKYMSANGIDMKGDSPMNIVSCLKGWDWDWKVTSQWVNPPFREEEEPA
jgi:hypothetical protein